jgi:hypothetical protein
LGGAEGLDGDLHDFRITKDGTALMTVYQVINKDLADLGKPIFGEIWDCLIQEVNIETGELVFQWRASDHYKVADTIKPIAEDGVIGRAFDFFHLNSIDKDSKGNYLISARFTRSLTYINGSDGEVIWIMGGKRNMFQDLSDGKATDFAYQHDARWSDDHTITMFDNGVDDGHPNLADTRGLRLKVDEEKMTAEVVAEYKNPHGIHGISQGSFQTLPNGNGFLGYGNTAAFTEYSHDGKVLCDVHFGAESRFGAGEVQSYRVYKYSWHGWPTNDPEVAILQNDSGKWSFYVSWNGATEVKEWVLQGSDSEENNEGWVDLERILKEGFETEFDIDSAYPQYIRVLGLDSSFNILGVGGSLDLTLEKVVFNISATDTGNGINSTQTWSLPPLRIEEGDTWWLKIMLGFCALGGMCVGLREAQTVWRTRRRARRGLSFPVNR